MAPTMMESIVMRKCGVTRKKAKTIIEQAREKVQLKKSMMWSKEWEEECLLIYQAEVDELAAKKKEEKAAFFDVNIKPTAYVRGTKTDICGTSAPKDYGLDIKPTMVPSKTKKAARAPVVVEDEHPAPIEFALSPRRPSIGRASARRPSLGRQRSLSRIRSASRSRSRGRALSKSREPTTQPENDEEKPRLRNKSATKKKKKAAKDGTKKKKKVKNPEPESEPVETPLMRRRSRSITKKLIYESGSEDDDRPGEWSDDAMSDDENSPSRHSAWLDARSPSIAKSDSDDAMSEDETPTHSRRSRSKTRQSSISDKCEHNRDDSAAEIESPLRMHPSRSKTRQSSFAEYGKHSGDDSALETESPLYSRRSRSKTRQSSISERIKHNGDDSALETESSFQRRRSRSRTRQSSISETDKSEPQKRLSSRHGRMSSASEDELGGSQHKVSKQPAPDRLSRRMSQHDGCEGGSRSRSVAKRMISAKDYETARQSERETSERGRRSSRCIERSGSARKLSERSFSPGRTVTEQVILFDDGDAEACTSSNLVPESPASKQTNALMQHLQSLEDAPGSAKMAPGKSKKTMMMVRSNSFGSRRNTMAADTDESNSDCEPETMRKGPLKTPSHGKTRQSSILRRNSKFAGKGSIDCPDSNSSKDWYNDSHSVVAV